MMQSLMYLSSASKGALLSLSAPLGEKVDTLSGATVSDATGAL